MASQDRSVRGYVDGQEPCLVGDAPAPEETGPDAFVRQQTAIMNRADSRPGLGTILCPTLVLVGADDTLTPPDRAAEMMAGIPGARQVVVPKCGHLSPLEQPQPVTDALVAFLSS